MFYRRNFFIRTLAAFAGDFAIGFSLAVACSWVIQYAALGLFLSFLLWIVAIVIALALSQHVVHPLVATVLSDHKLDDAIDAVSSLAESVTHFARGAGSPAWDHLRGSFGRYASSFMAR